MRILATSQGQSLPTAAELIDQEIDTLIKAMQRLSFVFPIAGLFIASPSVSASTDELSQVSMLRKCKKTERQLDEATSLSRMMNVLYSDSSLRFVIGRSTVSYWIIILWVYLSSCGNGPSSLHSVRRATLCLRDRVLGEDVSVVGLVRNDNVHVPCVI